MRAPEGALTPFRRCSSLTYFAQKYTTIVARPSRTYNIAYHSQNNIHSINITIQTQPFSARTAFFNDENRRPGVNPERRSFLTWSHMTTLRVICNYPVRRDRHLLKFFHQSGILSNILSLNIFRSFSHETKYRFQRGKSLYPSTKSRTISVVSLKRFSRSSTSFGFVAK